jgi:hypothetical protein
MLVCRLPAKSIEDHFQGLTTNNMQRIIILLSKNDLNTERLEQD